MVPLDVTSMHAPAVHMSWPQSVTRSLFTKSSTFMGAVDAQQIYIQRFVDFQSPKWLITSLQLIGGHRGPTRLPKPASNVKDIWLVVGFHTAWAESIGRALAEFKTSPVFALLGIAFNDCVQFAGGYSIRLSWKNGAPHLTTRGAKVYERHRLSESSTLESSALVPAPITGGRLGTAEVFNLSAILDDPSRLDPEW